MPDRCSKKKAARPNESSQKNNPHKARLSSPEASLRKRQYLFHAQKVKRSLLPQPTLKKDDYVLFGTKVA